MAIKEAGVRFSEANTACPTCGYSRLQGTAKRYGAHHLWVAYCPACRSVSESASIPDWFPNGLGAVARSRMH